MGRLNCGHRNSAVRCSVCNDATMCGVRGDVLQVRKNERKAYADKQQDEEWLSYELRAYRSRCSQLRDERDRLQVLLAFTNDTDEITRFFLLGWGCLPNKPFFHDSRSRVILSHRRRLTVVVSRKYPQS